MSLGKQVCLAYSILKSGAVIRSDSYLYAQIWEGIDALTHVTHYYEGIFPDLYIDEDDDFLGDFVGAV